MEHDLELFSPILEILEIGVCNIIYNPGNIGNGFVSFLISWKYWIVRSIISRIGLIYGLYDPIFPGYEKLEESVSNISRIIDNVADSNFQYSQDRTE